MCTVTIIPIEHGIRLACNRDEARTRPSALPPRVVACGTRQALMPIDPVGGGTWIAVNDAGLIITLLNFYAEPHRRDEAPPRRSRGTIIPTLAESASLADALARTEPFAWDDFAPFRLVLADRCSYAQLWFDGRSCQRMAVTPRPGALLFTSSGLGDAIVEAPRRALFDEFIVPGADWRTQQDAYHRHSWPERRHLSVCMSRPEARTVSYTIVELEETVARMTYHPDAPDQPIDAVVATMAVSSKR